MASKAKLTFQTLCPLWDNVLRTGKINRKLNMMDWAKCIVGEARLFNALKLIPCRQCALLGWQFMDNSRGKQKPKIIDKTRFENSKKELVTHISKAHMDEH